ncbi:hypothetical protein HNP47_000443 [Brevundimonas vesicularis]|uniref:Lipoprotein n=1 Tax=Brevundimonas vesicularis TaxID=41276 RepID=A0A7W9L4M6_BREVE|nr:hypothetical protein [Brevundimonas vesicularis]MBB5770474.1 hypothetical protein [Brevundimonas vesicularis]
MKTLSLIVVAATAALSACATPTTLTNPNLDTNASEFTGWVRVANGEFQLYQTQRDLRMPPSALRCVSGALPFNQQNGAQDLGGSKVVFTGRAVPWAEADGVQTIRHEGARITNQCRGDYVIKAQSVRVLR